MTRKEWWKKNGKIILIVVLAIALLLIIQYTLVDDLKPKKKKLGSANLYGDIPKGWTPDEMGAKLWDAIDGVDSVLLKETTYTRFNQLNPNQQIEVYNHWNDVYHDRRAFGLPFGAQFGTLRQAISDEWYNGAERAKALGNLETLNLP